MANTVSKDTLWVSQSGTSTPFNSENLRISESDSNTFHGLNENYRITFNNDTSEEPVFWDLKFNGALSSGLAITIPASLPSISSMYLGEVELTYKETPVPEGFTFHTFETTYGDLPEYGIEIPAQAAKNKNIVLIFVPLPSNTMSENFDILINFEDSTSLEGVVPFKAPGLDFLNIPSIEGNGPHYNFDKDGFYISGFGSGTVSQLKINGSVVESFVSNYSAPTQYLLRTTIPNESIPSLSTFSLEISYISDNDSRTVTFEITNPDYS